MPTHFVVERFNWRRGRQGQTLHRFPGVARVATFETFAEAEVFRRLGEARAWDAVGNPFAGSLRVPTEQSSLPPDILADWLLDRGIDPPEPAADSARDWKAWWEANAPTWDAGVRAMLREGLDRVRFYQVRECEARPVAYAVVQVLWDYNDEFNYPGAEGGETLTVYRRREKAEQVCRERNEVERLAWQGEVTQYNRPGDDFDLEGRVLPDRDPFADPPTPSRPVDRDDLAEEGYGGLRADEVPYFEVVEIELEGAR